MIDSIQKHNKSDVIDSSSKLSLDQEIVGSENIPLRFQITLAP